MADIVTFVPMQEARDRFTHSQPLKKERRVPIKTLSPE
jgi:hypothetical protein